MRKVTDKLTKICVCVCVCNEWILSITLLFLVPVGVVGWVGCRRGQEGSSSGSSNRIRPESGVLRQRPHNKEPTATVSYANVKVSEVLPHICTQ